MEPRIESYGFLIFDIYIRLLNNGMLYKFKTMLWLLRTRVLYSVALITIIQTADVSTDNTVFIKTNVNLVKIYNQMNHKSRQSTSVLQEEGKKRHLLIVFNKQVC